MGRIELVNMEFYSYHGCLENEKKIGNKFIVNLECEYPMEVACNSDMIEAALNYSDLYEVIKTEMEKPSNLLENVAWRILNKIKSNFPHITSAKISIAKLNPPLSGHVESSKVILSF
jgi:dihydroneopterin aldolase